MGINFHFSTSTPIGVKRTREGEDEEKLFQLCTTSSTSNCITVHRLLKPWNFASFEIFFWTLNFVREDPEPLEVVFVAMTQPGNV